MDNDLRNRFRGISGSRSAAGRPPVRPSAPRPTTTRPPQFVPPAPSVKQPEPTKVTNNLEYASVGAAPRKKAPKRKKLTKFIKKYKYIFIVLLVVLLVLGGLSLRNKRNNNSYLLGSGQKTPAPGDGVPNGTLGTETTSKAVQGSVRLVGTGDMIAHDSVNANARKADGSYDYLPLMDKMKPYFEKADIRFCNQATPAGGEQFGITGYPVFNAPVAFARGIESVGCNVLNLGTNHTNDKGQPLIDATAAAWDNRAGILAFAGANRSVGEQNQNHFFTVKGLKVAYVSYTTYTNNTSVTPYGLNMYSDALATAQITEARKNADIVIVSMRWGTEYSPDVNAQQDAIAQTLTNLGADVVLGHGSHFLEPVKRLKNADGTRESIVWYSLGNFLNTQLEAESLVGGFAVMDIDLATKKISSSSFMPTYMHYDWTAAEKKSNNLMARKNLTMVPLDQAAELLARSQLGTTVEAQTARVTSVLNKYTNIKIIKSSEY